MTGGATDPWRALAAELDAWEAAGLRADFWWRDDDAVDATPALDRLLGLRARLGAPLALAVIPAGARPELAAAVGKTDAIDILQHGYAHANHRPAGAKKAELGADRALWDIAREIADGRGRLCELFGDDGWIDVMVPPWNRIDATVAAILPGLGFHGLTSYRDRNLGDARPGLRIVNTHIDIVDWKDTRGFAGAAPLIADTVARLAAQRRRAADGTGRKAATGNATGLLTHHLAHDDACWTFIDRFVAETAAHPAARWRAARDLFPPPD